jgi:hypothetical protein
LILQEAFMKRIALSIILLLSFASSGQALVTDVFQFSGYEWARWDSPSKYGFIGGFIAGGAYVAIGSQTEMVNKPQESKIESGELAGSSDNKDVVTTLIMYLQDDKEKDLARYFIKGVPSDQLVNGLDALYKNRHHRGIKVVDAIYLVRKQLEGASREEINATIEYLISGKDIKKLHYTDANGKFQAVIFP